jgi:predicted nucleic acid-binding protein
MKTRLIAVLSFLALFFSINLSAHHDKAFHEAKMAVVKHILEKNGVVDEVTQEAIIADFHKLKHAAKKCLLNCFNEHKAKMMKAPAVEEMPTTATVEEIPAEETPAAEQ